MASQKVLVIDDSGIIRMKIKEMLPPGKINVIEAKNGEDGLNKIQSEQPNIIILDFILPKKTGWEVYQFLQKDAKLRTIPLILMSGRKEEVTDKLPEPFKYFAFMAKPFSQGQLMAAIKEALKKAKTIPPLEQTKPIEKSAPSAAPSKSAKSAPNATSAPAPSADSSGEIESLKKKVAHMNAEIESLKKKVNQLVMIIKQKLK